MKFANTFKSIKLALEIELDKTNLPIRTITDKICTNNQLHREFDISDHGVRNEFNFVRKFSLAPACMLSF